MNTCRKCGGEVEERTHTQQGLEKRKKRLREGRQAYYFLRWWKCKQCRTQYMDNDAKVSQAIDETTQEYFDLFT